MRIYKGTSRPGSPRHRAYRAAAYRWYVRDRLLILTGEVRLYEHKLIIGRIAWTARNAFEVDNEIHVLPRVPLSGRAIERRIREIVKSSERLRAARIAAAVVQGKVLIEGSFLDFSEPTDLKHSVAAIEGVVDIDIQAVFLT